MQLVRILSLLESRSPQGTYKTGILAKSSESRAISAFQLALWFRFQLRRAAILFLGLYPELQLLKAEANRKFKGHTKSFCKCFVHGCSETVRSDSLGTGERILLFKLLIRIDRTVRRPIPIYSIFLEPGSTCREYVCIA